MSILRIFSDFIIALIIIIGLMYIDFLILLILVSSITILLSVYFFYFRNKIRKYGQDLIFGSNLMNEGLISIINGLKEIKILGIFRTILSSTEKGSEIVYLSSFKDRLVQIAPRYVLEFVLVLFAIIVVAIGIFLNRSEVELISLLGVFAAASLRLAPMSNQILSSFTTLQFSKASVDDLFSELKNINHLDTKYNSSIIKDEKELFSSIEINNGYFKYDKESQWVLENININIKRGKFIGIVGESGSGKSTLVDILLGLLDLNKGSLLINKKKFSQRKQYWQSKFAYIPQNIF